MIVAFALGFVAGLRTFTAPAVLLLMRAGTWPAYVLGVAALAEYAGDLHPNAPSRTQPLGLIARLCSGAFCGWLTSAITGVSAPVGAGLGALGAIFGAFLGLRARTAAIGRIGRIPAAIAEDIVAIGAAVAIVLLSNPTPA